MAKHGGIEKGNEENARMEEIKVAFYFDLIGYAMQADYMGLLPVTYCATPGYTYIYIYIITYLPCPRTTHVST